MIKYILVSILIFYITVESFAQKISVEVNDGHKLMVKSMVFSTNDQYFFSGGWDKTIKMWEVKTCKEVKTFIGHKSHVNVLQTTENPNELFSGGIYELFRWNTKTGVYRAYQCNYNIKSMAYVQGQLYVSHQNKIYVYPKNQRYARLWMVMESDIVDMKIKGEHFFALTKSTAYKIDRTKKIILKEYKRPVYDQLKTIEIQGSRLLMAGVNQVYIWDIEKDSYKGMIKDAHQHAYIYDNTVLAKRYGAAEVAQYAVDSVKRIRVFEKPQHTPVSNITVSHHEKYVLGYGYNQFVLWDTKSGKIYKEFYNSRVSLNEFSLFHEQLCYGTGVKGNVRFFDLTQLTYANQVKYHSKSVHTNVKIGEQILLNGHDGKAVVYDPVSKNKVQELNIDNPQAIHKPPVEDNSFTGILNELKGGEKVYGVKAQHKTVAYSFDNDIKLLDLEKKKYVQTLDKHQDLVKDMSFLSKNRLVSVSLDKTAILWDTKKGKLLKTFYGHTDRIFAVEKITETSFVTGGADGLLLQWSVKEKEALKLTTLPYKINDIASANSSLAIAHSNGVLVYDLTSKSYKELIHQNYEIEQVAWMNDSLLITRDERHFIQFWHPKKGLIATLLTTKLGAVTYTPDGYYFGDKESVQDNIHFKIEDKIFLFEQFDVRFNRPDIVLQRIGLASKNTIKTYRSAFLKRIEKLGLLESDFSQEFELPKVQIVNAEMLNEVVNEKEITIKVKAFDEHHRLQHIQLWVNDVQVNQKEIEQALSTSQSNYDGELKIQLSKGENKIQVQAINEKGVASFIETIHIKCLAGKEKPTLYLIAIGESKYQDPSFNLTYAAKDAKDISSLMLQSERYVEVKSKQLLNEEVTLENVQALHSFLEQASVDDEVIIFLAGHGVLDKDFNYFFASYDMDFNNPSVKGIPYAEIEGLLENIPPRKKLLLLDACHSGEVEKKGLKENSTIPMKEGKVTFRAVGKGVVNESSEQDLLNLSKYLFSDLRRGTGATIISSAGGLEFAIESEEWYNGLFTYCFLNGIKNREADLNKDGEIWLSELKKYVIKQVALLSKGQQLPSCRLENLTVDYRVW